MKTQSAKIPPKKNCPIWSRAGLFSDPVDYERGELALPPIIPQHILFFSRHSRNSLLKQTSKVKHHRFVMIIILEGSGDVCVDERIFHCEGGHMLLLFPFQFHHYLSFPQSEIRWLFCTFELKEPSVLEPLKNRLRPITPKIFDMIREIVEEVPTSQPYSPEQATMLQLRLALVLHQLLCTDSDSPKPSPAPVVGEGAILLDKVHQYIYKNISREFSIQELAHHVGYSESHLRNLFRNLMLMSLGRYINELRLRKATGLLHQGDLNISQVAEMSGYSSLFSFSRAFRRALDCSPSKYKENCRIARESQTNGVYETSG